MPTRPSAALAALLGLLLLATPACAEGEEGTSSEAAEAGEQESTDPTATSEMRGKHFWVETATVVSVDAEAGTLTVDEPDGRFTYGVDEATLLRKGGETLSLERLEEGDRLAISAHQGLDPEDPPVADTVQVVVVDVETGEPVRRGDLGSEGSGSGAE